jgi:hypothetical protein
MMRTFRFFLNGVADECGALRLSTESVLCHLSRRSISSTCFGGQAIVRIQVDWKSRMTLSER